MPKIRQEEVRETIAEECKCYQCGRFWKIILDGKMGVIPEKYREEYEAHVEQCIRKPKEEAAKRGYQPKKEDKKG